MRSARYLRACGAGLLIGGLLVSFSYVGQDAVRAAGWAVGAICAAVLLRMLGTIGQVILEWRWAELRVLWRIQRELAQLRAASTRAQQDAQSAPPWNEPIVSSERKLADD
jgi:hypothetical protein